MRLFLYLVGAAGAAVFLFAGVKIQNSTFVAETASLFNETFGTRTPIAEIDLAGDFSSSPEAGIGVLSDRTVSQGGTGEKTTSKAAVSANSPPAPCSATTTAPTHAALINEVAWAGTAGNKTADEWIELKNNLGRDISLNGWQLTNKSGDLKIFFGAANILRDGSYHLLERGDDGVVPNIAADKIFTGLIKNSDEALHLFNGECELIDEVIADVGSKKEWPGGTASPDYRSTKRALDLSWHSFSGTPFDVVHGTPKAMNLAAFNVGAPAAQATTTTSQVSTQTSLSVSSGAEQNNISAVPLVSEIMAGVEGNPAYDFIELYNPGASVIALTGWSVKKKTTSGKESTLVASGRLDGKIIPAGKHFLLARAGGYSGNITADVPWPSSDSYNLSYTDNSVVLYSPNGIKIEEVSWIKISEGKSLTRNSWTSDQFSIQDPTPQNSQ